MRLSLFGLALRQPHVTTDVYYSWIGTCQVFNTWNSSVFNRPGLAFNSKEFKESICKLNENCHHRRWHRWMRSIP
jgi:hypothetical protein